MAAVTEKETFDLVLQLGETMLSAGGEIFRTNAIMDCAARRFGLSECSVFTIANGIFVSAVVDGVHHSCQVRHIPLSPLQLDRVEAMNDLSRRIEAGKVDAQQAREELTRIRALSGPGPLLQILASGVGSASFCFLFGGIWKDCAVALCAGLLLYVFLLFFCQPFHIGRVMSNILSSAVVTLLCCAAFQLGLGPHLDRMIIGAIFPLVPGVPLAISVRNFMENDYLAGLVRLTDAVLTAGCIAIGVGCVMITWNIFWGGVAL